MAVQPRRPGQRLQIVANLPTSAVPRCAAPARGRAAGEALRISTQIRRRAAASYSSRTSVQSRPAALMRRLAAAIDAATESDWARTAEQLFAVHARPVLLIWNEASANERS